VGSPSGAFRSAAGPAAPPRMFLHPVADRTRHEIAAGSGGARSRRGLPALSQLEGSFRLKERSSLGELVAVGDSSRAMTAHLLAGSPTQLLSRTHESVRKEASKAREFQSLRSVSVKRELLCRAATAVRLGGFSLLSSLSPALLHHVRQSLSGGCAHSTAPLPCRPAVHSRALSGAAGRVNSLE
jgi:hypothetical protein